MQRQQKHAHKDYKVLRVLNIKNAGQQINRQKTFYTSSQL